MDFLHNPRTRNIFWQLLIVGAVVFLALFFIDNTLDNLALRNIGTGLGYLKREAGFGIGESLIDYSPADTYFRAYIVGLLNTLLVAFIGIILATILGTTVGIARLSSNWLLAKLAAAYVDTVRNVPLLLQLFLWYGVITETLPAPRQALQPIPGVFLSNRGFLIPAPVAHPVWTWVLAAAVVGILLSVLITRWARQRQAATGRPFPTGLVSTLLIIGLPLLTFFAGGSPTDLNVPELRGFNFRGGARLSPEFATLLLGLTIYTAGFIAEIVRSGILAVSGGQTEAALALGLDRRKTLRLVILPQALRLIVPPITSQYLNLTKNSSLAVAIGYPDLVSVANTSINQTGQAIEGIAVVMAVFLTISLTIATLMNWYNARLAFKER